MPLRQRLDAVLETVQEFELASAQRYREGASLAASGFGGAGVYLLGYTAEMLLKNAYFRFTGAQPGDLIQPRLGPARNVGRSYIPHVPHESYHSLHFWALLLRETRRRQHRPLADDVDAPFMSRTRRLHQNWSVEMRYQRDQAQPREVQSVYEDVTWLRDNSVALWR